jgi:CO dehydrogenase/acetyl-CoA synthase epsilon subunit
MSTYSIKDIPFSTDRYKLYTLLCKAEELEQSIAFIQSENIRVINIGKKVAQFIERQEDHSYINIEVFEHTKKLLDDNKTSVSSSGNYAIAIYNLGILLEPRFNLNVAQMLKEFSKSAALIIIWEYEFEPPNKLYWPVQNEYLLEFLDTPLKKLHHAI